MKYYIYLVMGAKKLVKFHVKANPSGQYYFPKEVRKELGEKLVLVCGVKVAIVYPPSLSFPEVITSLDLIKQHIALEFESESKKKEALRKQQKKEDEQK